MKKAVNKIKSIFTLIKRKHVVDMKRNTAKAKRLDGKSIHNKNRDNNSTETALVAFTNFVETLGLGI